MNKIIFDNGVQDKLTVIISCLVDNTWEIIKNKNKVYFTFNMCCYQTIYIYDPGPGQLGPRPL